MKHASQMKRTSAGPLPWRIAAALMALLLLAACASNRPEDPYKKDDKRKAAETNTSLGAAYMKRGQYEVALGKLKLALADDPKYAPAHTVIAVLYERIGERALAGKHYRKAFDADPKNGDVNNNYAVFLCQSGKTDAALEHFEAALKDPFYSSPKVALTNAGSCALQAGKIDAAETYLRRALKYDDAFPDALITMARLNYRKKNYMGARAFMQRFEAVGPVSASSLLLGLQVEMALNDRAGADTYLATLSDKFPDSDETAKAQEILHK